MLFLIEALFGFMWVLSCLKKNFYDTDIILQKLWLWLQCQLPFKTKNRKQFQKGALCLVLVGCCKRKWFSFKEISQSWIPLFLFFIFGEKNFINVYLYSFVKSIIFVPNFVKEFSKRNITTNLTFFCFFAIYSR